MAKKEKTNVEYEETIIDDDIITPFKPLIEDTETKEAEN